jgi:hypothetical protein
MTRKGKAWRALAVAMVGYVALSIAAPHFRVDGLRARIQASLARALGREVEIGDIRFTLFAGPGFALERVVIHDSPAMGIEPLAYVESLTARPRILSLVRGRLEFSSVRLENASINLVKTGPLSEPGHWNFEPLLNRNLIAAFPSIHLVGEGFSGDSRINFKFGDTKSVFYVTKADVDVTPPAPGGSVWKLRFSGEPARTDRPARGFGSLEAKGRWNGENLDLDLRVDENEVSEVIALVRGEHVGIHGLVSSRLHIGGPLDDLRINGNMVVQDIHRWDQMPPHGNQWPLNVSGRLNLLNQSIEIVSASASRETPPIAVRFRLSNYLSQPHWGVSMNCNRFPLAPLVELARHMGVQVPPKLRVAGTMDGAIGYGGQGSLQGVLGFHDTVVTIPDSAPMRFEAAQLLFDHGHLHLAPAVVRTAQDDQAQVEADYAFDSQELALSISTGSMDVASLRSQVALAAVPWLEQVQAGHWKGQLRYTWRPSVPDEEEEPVGWTGKIELANAVIPIDGLADPVKIESASAQIDGPRIALDRLRVAAGKIQAQGEYRYEPGTQRPHHVRLQVAELDGSELERELSPVLLRRRGLIQRALNLGKVPEPDWLRTRRVDGTVQVGVLRFGKMPGDTRVEHVRAHMLWDGLKAEFGNLQARLENGSVTGTLSVNLRGARPAYRLSSRLKAMDCRAGKVDAETVLDTSGTGPELLENLKAAGTFSGRAMEIAELPPFKTISGAFKFAWRARTPRLELSDLQLATGAEIFTGKGATQDDGKLVVELSSGAREMRVSGTLAQLHVDAIPPQ